MRIVWMIFFLDFQILNLSKLLAVELFKCRQAAGGRSAVRFSRWTDLANSIDHYDQIQMLESDGFLRIWLRTTDSELPSSVLLWCYVNKNSTSIRLWWRIFSNWNAVRHRTCSSALCHRETPQCESATVRESATAHGHTDGRTPCKRQFAVRQVPQEPAMVFSRTEKKFLFHWKRATVWSPHCGPYVLSNRSDC